MKSKEGVIIELELSIKYESDSPLTLFYKSFNRHLIEDDDNYSRFSFLDLNNSSNGITITLSESLDSFGLGALSVFHNHLN